MINALVIRHNTKNIYKRHMQFLTSAQNFRGSSSPAPLTRPSRAPVLYSWIGGKQGTSAKKGNGQYGREGDLEDLEGKRGGKLEERAGRERKERGRKGIVGKGMNPRILETCIDTPCLSGPIC